MNDSMSTEKVIWTGNQPQSAMRRTSSGMNSTRDSLRTSSGKPFTPGMIAAAASRPLTQQGMTGLQPPPTAGIGLNRQYRDKRYYVALIQNHATIIKDEIKNLQKKLLENKLDATNYEECKRQVENYTKQLAEHEESLLVYNTAIECSMLKNSRNNLAENTEKLRRSNQLKVNQLESIFSDKIVREEHFSKIQAQIEHETQAFNDMVATFPEKERQQYYALWRKNEELKNEEDVLKNEINQMKKDINMYEQNIFQNEQKRIRYNLMTKYNELSKRYEKLREENKVKRTPSEEREYLLEQVKQDRADMQSFKTQREELNIELEKLKERHNELEDELSEKNSARLNKYKELLKRQEAMESFLETFEEVYGEEVNRLTELRASIVFSLEYISGNSVDTNFDDVNNSQSYVLNPTASKEELKQEFKKLISQLNMLNYVKKRLDSNVSNLKEQEEKFKSELRIYQNLDRARDDLRIQQESLETQRQSLKKMLHSTRDAVLEAERKRIEVDIQLNTNEDYVLLSALEKQYESMKAITDQQSATIESMKKMDNFENIKMDAMYLVNNIFGNIWAKLSSRN